MESRKLSDISKFLLYNLMKSKPEDTNNGNRHVAKNKMKTVIRSITKKKSPGPDKLIAEFYQTLKMQY